MFHHVAIIAIVSSIVGFIAVSEPTSCRGYLAYTEYVILSTQVLYRLPGFFHFTVGPGTSPLTKNDPGVLI